MQRTLFNFCSQTLSLPSTAVGSIRHVVFQRTTLLPAMTLFSSTQYSQRKHTTFTQKHSSVPLSSSTGLTRKIWKAFFGASALSYASLSMGSKTLADKEEKESLSLEEMKACLAIFQYPLPQKRAEETQEEFEQRCRDFCFSCAYQLCQDNHWEKIEAAKMYVARLRDQWGRTLFLKAVEEGNFKCVNGLLERKIAIYKTDREGNNGLHLAAINGHISLIPLLARYFAINSDMNKEGYTALHLAIRQGQSDSVKVLRKTGASLDILTPPMDGTAFSPIAFAVMHGQIDCLDALLDGNDPKKTLLSKPIPKIGNLLHLSLLRNQFSMMQHLLSIYTEDVKPLFDHQDAGGKTPFHLASYLGDMPAVRLLSDSGIDLDQQDSQGRTAVHWAVLGQQPRQIELLDYLGANLSIQDHNHQTPWDLTARAETEAQRNCRALLDALPNVAKAEKRNPPDYLNHPPENLVLKGGGPKGFAYIGALQVMADQGLLSELKRVAGTSAGAITAALLAVGYTPEELSKIMLGKDTFELLDPKGRLEADLVQLAQNPTVKAGLAAIARDYWQGGSAILHPIRNAEEVYKRLLECTGLCKGDTFQQWIDDLIYEKTGIRDCTFEELHRKAVNAKQCKDLHIFAVRLGGKRSSEPEPVRFEWENYGNLTIASAIRASMSIPGVFKPHILRFKDQQGTFLRPELGSYVDGGVLKNYPLDAFDDRKYQNQKNWGGESNRKTLGLSLHVDRPLNEALHEPKDAVDIVKQVLVAYWDAQEILSKEKAYNRDRTIVIHLQKVSLLDFKLSMKKKLEMIQQGKNTLEAKFPLTRNTANKPYVDPLKYQFTSFKPVHPDFQGRDGYIQQLEHLFFSNPAQNLFLQETLLHLLYGIPGVGKTELTSAFAQRYSHRFSIIFTFHMDDQLQLQKEYEELAKKLHLHLRQGMNLQELQNLVHGSLENNPFGNPWLLIMLNVKKTLENSDYPQKGGYVLATAGQKSALRREQNQIEIKPFDRGEGEELLIKITGESKSPEMEQLIVDTEGFPFLLNQIAHYIKSVPGLTIKKYQEAFDLKNQPLQAGISLDSNHPLALNTIWQNTLDQLEIASPLAFEWLNTSAYLYSHGIPASWVEEWLKQRATSPTNVPPSDMRQILQDSYEIRRILTNHRLMQYDPERNIFILHHLLQEVLKERQKKTQSNEQVLLTTLRLAARCEGGLDNRFIRFREGELSPKQEESLVNALSRLEPTADSDYFLTAIDYLTERGNRYLQTDVPYRASQSLNYASELFFKRYPSLKDYKSKTEQEICSVLSSNLELPILFSRLLHYQGKSLFLSGNVDKAAPSLEKAAALRSHLGQKPSSIFIATHFEPLIFQRQGLGWLLMENNQFNETEALYQKLFYYPKSSEDMEKYEKGLFGTYETDWFNQAYCNLQLARLYLKRAKTGQEQNYLLAMQRIEKGGNDKAGRQFEGALAILEKNNKAARFSAYLLVLGDLYLDSRSPYYDLTKARDIFANSVMSIPENQRKLKADTYCKLAEADWSLAQDLRFSKKKLQLKKAEEEVEISIQLYQQLMAENQGNTRLSSERQEVERLKAQIDEDLGSGGICSIQ